LAIPLQGELRLHGAETRAKELRTLANLFLIAWASVLLQGALRKWIFPGATILYLAQDLPLLIAYLYALHKKIFWEGSLVFLCMIIALVLSIQTLVQVIFVEHALTVGIIGLHHYIFYLPIVFLLPPCMNEDNRQRFIRFNLWSNIPMALIAAFQAISPPGAWINRTSAGDDTAFMVGNGAVRATGTFNFTMSFSIWCGIAVALTLGEWLRPPQERAIPSRIVLALSTISVFIATLDSASRTAIFLGGAALLGAFAVVIVTRRYKHLLLVGAMTLALPVLTVAAYFVAPLAFSGLIDRFSGQESQREMTSRMTDLTFNFIFMPSRTIIGEGIGKGIQAAHVGSSTAYDISLAEMENLRLIQELGPISGTAVVLIRYIAGISMLIASFRLRKVSSARLSAVLPLAFTLAPTLMIGELIRSAPVVATQTYFFVSLICGEIVFRDERLCSSQLRISREVIGEFPEP
jgi:hypothetical protein